MDNTEFVLFETNDNCVSLKVNLKRDTVWLSLDQLSELFERDKSTISRHIKNIFNEEELTEDAVVAFFATTASDGKVYDVAYYNLDVIISVGYRVKSKRGVEFRKWANTVLRDYILKGYALNNNRLSQLGAVIRILKRTNNQLEAAQVLDVIERYTLALNILDDYDHQNLKKPSGTASTYVLTYDECRKVIDKMKFSKNSLFGNEKDDSFKSSISVIYQAFGGVELYPSVEEKAANLLYFVTKNHSFSDGNKRIAAAMFLYFLDKNNVLFVDNRKRVDDYTLVAITIMIAESKPEEKETMIKLVMNFLV